MVTVFTTQPTIEDEMPAKPFKQVQINAEELRQYIRVIAERVREGGKELVRHAEDLDPPYPLSMVLESHENNQFYLSDLGLASYSALLALHADMKSVDEPEWQACITEYANLSTPDPSKGEERYKGMESPPFRDEILKVSEQIGQYLNEQSTKPAYLMRGESVNHRVVISLALIWLGRKLQAEEKAAKTEEG